MAASTSGTHSAQSDDTVTALCRQQPCTQQLSGTYRLPYIIRPVRTCSDVPLSRRRKGRRTLVFGAARGADRDHLPLRMETTGGWIAPVAAPSLTSAIGAAQIMVATRRSSSSALCAAPVPYDARSTLAGDLNAPILGGSHIATRWHDRGRREGEGGSRGYPGSPALAGDQGMHRKVASAPGWSSRFCGGDGMARISGIDACTRPISSWGSHTVRKQVGMREPRGADHKPGAGVRLKPPPVAAGVRYSPVRHQPAWRRGQQIAGLGGKAAVASSGAGSPSGLGQD